MINNQNKETISSLSKKSIPKSNNNAIELSPPHSRKQKPFRVGTAGASEVISSYPAANPTVKRIGISSNNGSTINSTRNRRSLMSVDIVTGKELVYVYLDSTKIVHDGSGSNLTNSNLNLDWLEEHQYTPASIVKEDISNNLLTLRLMNGEVIKMSYSDAVKISTQDDSGVRDILNLKVFSEKSLIYTLRVRYNRDEIYTFAGPILMSLNPYKTIDNLYGEEEMMRYHTQSGPMKMSELPPHLFVIGECAYTALMQSTGISSGTVSSGSGSGSGSGGRAVNQSIIISGESGAGKTEATKLIMSYLARITVLHTQQQRDTHTQSTGGVSGTGVHPQQPSSLDIINAASSTDDRTTSTTTRYTTPTHSTHNRHTTTTSTSASASPSSKSLYRSLSPVPSSATAAMTALRDMELSVSVSVGELEQKVLNTNPILEAFGNAQTLRNDNSSRFGKFIKIQFSRAGCIVGACIQRYLLEKTRVVSQSEGERNYHIFYHLLAAFNSVVDHPNSLSTSHHSSVATTPLVTPVATPMASTNTNNNNNTNTNDSQKTFEFKLLPAAAADSTNTNNNINKSTSNGSGNDNGSSSADGMSSSLVSVITHLHRTIKAANSNNMVSYTTVPKPEHFHYLSYQHTTVIDINETYEFKKLLACLQSVSISQSTQHQLFSLLMGILYLGNVKFQENNDENQVPGIVDDSILDFHLASQFLGLQENDLLFALTKQNMHVGGNVIVKVASQLQAYDKKDSLCKSIYSMLFTWLVDTINLTIAATTTSATSGGDSASACWGFIGILDIYGFENFAVNGFEQLLINYANEKLQNHFNKHIFQIEQNEYIAESIDWSFIQYYDNQTCIDLIDSKINGRTGIFMTLDDISMSANQSGTRSSGDVNNNFLTQINASWAFASNTTTTSSNSMPSGFRVTAGSTGTTGGSGSGSTEMGSPTAAGAAASAGGSGAGPAGRHPNYLTPRFNSDQFFGILHYAGDVYYCTQGFVEKNKESTSLDAKDLMLNSSNDILSNMMEETIMGGEYSSSGGSGMSMGGVGGSSMKSSSNSNSCNPGFASPTRLNMSEKTATALMSSSTPASSASVAVAGVTAGAGAGVVSSKTVTSMSGKFVSKLKEDSISRQFTQSLRQLYELLDGTQPHYIRCIKPNRYKEADRLHSKQCLDQLRCAGMMEAIRIRQEGYALRQNHHEFYQRFHPILPSCKTLVDLVKQLSIMLNVHAESWQLGTTKIFIKTDMNDKLENLLWLRYTTASRIIQKLYRYIQYKMKVIKAQSMLRMYLYRKDYKRLKLITIQFQSLLKMYAVKKRYRAMVASAIAIQTYIRGYQCRIAYKSLKSPYLRMSYEELTNLYTEYEATLQHAMQQQEFAKCDDLQYKLNDIKTIRSQYYATTQPIIALSRKEIELLLIELNYAYKYAILHYREEISLLLQNHINFLQAEKSKYPTIEELNEALANKKLALETALSKKEFKKCTELRDNIQRLENQLEIAMFTGSYAHNPPLHELKLKRQQLEAEIQTHLQAHLYELCDRLQYQLEPINQEIERLDISVTAAESRVAVLRVEREAKWLQLDFKAMACIDVAISELEAVIAAATATATASTDTNTDATTTTATADTTAKATAAADGNNNTDTTTTTSPSQPKHEEIKSRIHLEELILSCDSQLHSALTSKHYKSCDELNAKLDYLKSNRVNFPTSIELQEQIQALENQVAMFLQQKNYIQCDLLETQITVLKDRYAEVKSTEPVREITVAVDLSPTIKAAVRPSAYATTDIMMAVAAATGSNTHSTTTNTNAINISRKLQFNNNNSNSTSASAAFNENNSNNNSVKSKKHSSHSHGDSKSVAKLRPKPPVTLADTAMLVEVSKAMTKHRVSAVLLVSSSTGTLTGILTDNDITRRVIAVRKNPAATTTAEVMTKQPKCVHMSDSALDALDLMVCNKFRHLPVLDENDAVVGLLDIAKCLHDAISALEKLHDVDNIEKDDSKAVMATAMTAALKKATAAGGGAGGKKGSNKSQLAAMQALMEQMFGDSIPTLRGIIGEGHLVSVGLSTSVSEAAAVMASAHKGVLVMDATGSQLLGILTTKDVMNRVVSKELNPDDTIVSAVMTPNPDCVSADLTLIDALREMHDHKFLHLPVKDSDGTVLGLVDVMELVCTTAGGEDGKGWRDFFQGAMDARDDDHSDSASDHSASNRSKHTATGTGAVSHSSVNQSPKLSQQPMSVDRPVSKLRPKAPLLLSQDMTVQEVSEALSSRRVDAGLLVDADNSLQGIITDNDITRRLIAQFVDPTTTIVSAMMTASPKCVKMTGSALDALDTMVVNRFRHLPVLDDSGSIVGLLDIAKCLHDAISALEKIQEQPTEGADVEKAVMAEAMVNAMIKAGTTGITATNKKGKILTPNKNQLAAMQAMMEQMFGESVPTLRDIIGNESMVSIKGSSNVREATILMAKARKGVLVMDDGKLVGILTPKDVLNRVVSVRKSPDLTAVSSVMTPNPDCVSADLTLIDALREMHDHKFLHLPVKDSDGTVLGLVDVMELVCTTAGGEDGKGWRDFFQGAMDARGDDHSDSTSEHSGQSFGGMQQNHKDRPRVPAVTLLATTSPRNRSPSDPFSDITHHITEFSFKVVDSEGHIHRMKSSIETLEILKENIITKLELNASITETNELLLKYIDDDKDDIVITSDAALREAVEFARHTGSSTLKLDIKLVPKRKNSLVTTVSTSTSNQKSVEGDSSAAAKDNVKGDHRTILLVGGALTITAIAAIAGFVLSRKK